MSGTDPFDDALDATIDAMHRGRPLDAALSDLRGQDAGMRPLLETAAALRGSPGAPLSRRLAHNYAIVQAAVERAQIAARSQPSPVAPTPTSWWKRKVTFASLSIPAGAAVVVLTAGAAAAATASVATTEIGSRVAEVVLPAQLASHLPGGDTHGNTGAPPADPGNGNSPSPFTDEAPGGDNRPTQITVSGVVSGINGATFTLTNGDGAWLVQTDSATIITGNLWEEASATVAGVATAEQVLHAESVVSSGGVEPVDHSPPSDESEAAPPEDRGGADPPTSPDVLATPPVEASGGNKNDKKTPPANRTVPPTPPAHGPSETPGQGNGSDEYSNEQ